MATIYFVPVSFNCLGATLVDAHLNLNTNREIVDIMNGACRTPEFLAMNPMHCIPTYKNANGDACWEGNIIVRQMAAGSNLIPADAHGLMRMEQALYFRTLQLYKVIAPLVYPILGFAAPLDAAAHEKALNEANEMLDVFFNHFAKNGSFAIGDLSIAGMYSCVYIPIYLLI